MKINRLLIILWIMSYSNSVLSSDMESEQAFQASDYFSIPYLPEDISQGIIVVNIDQSTDMLERAYTSLNFDVASNDGTVGYFDPQSQYRYSSENDYFEVDSSLTRGQENAWDGQFLNWLLMRQIDMTRYFFLGTQKEQSLDKRGFTDLIILEASNKQLTVQNTNSALYSPLANYIPLTIESGQLKYQGRHFQLRLKNIRHQKGLVDLLTDNVSFYFYAHKTINKAARDKQAYIFGDAQKLPSYLKNWTASEPKNNQASNKYRDDSLGAFQNALEIIKQDTLKNIQNTPHKIPCQRYVHLSIFSSKNHTQYMNQHKTLEDCQKGLSGKQALTYFQLAASDKLDTLAQNSFSFHEMDALIASTFVALVGEKEQLSFQMSGADMASFSDQSSVMYQALYKYVEKGVNHNLNWLGDLRAVFVDDQGRLRNDNGDKKLGSIDEDPLLSSCFDEKNQLIRFRFITKPETEGNCNALNYPYFEKDVGYLWQASDSFRRISHASSNRQRSSFQSNDRKRYIRTHIGQTEYDFVEQGKESGRYPLKPEWLNVSTQEEADNLINFIRGQDQQHARARHTNKQSYLLGDTTNNSPLVVGKPTSNYHLLFGDPSYQTFLKQYENRRSRVFLGANDGLLHSFNAGWFDSSTKHLKASSAYNKWELGQETWAFVPFSVLPYLSELRDKYYGISPYHHLNVSPQKPYVFDAKIFDEKMHGVQKDRVFNDEEGNVIGRKTHPQGWGTLMVVGSGLGGSYLVFDITDAEQAPKLMAELQVSTSGSAISLPTVMTRKNKQGELEWDLVLGSGGDGRSQNSAGLHVYNLTRIQSESAAVELNLIDLQERQSYVTGISAADWNLDGETDALYINTANHSGNSGSLFRVNIQNTTSNQLHFDTTKLLDANASLIERPQLSVDALNNRWIYISTGHDLQTKKTYPVSLGVAQKHKIIGLKEPRNQQGDFLIDSAQKSSSIPLRSLVDVSAILVNAGTGKLNGKWSIQPELKEKTVNELEARLMQFSESPSYVHGWLRQLDENELSTGPSKLFGGILTQASYQRVYKNCQLTANAFMYRLRFTTGTSWYSQKNMMTQAKEMRVELKNTKTDTLGSTELTSILLQEGRDSVHQIQSSKNAQTHTTVEEGRKLIKSGEVSWRAL